MTVLLLHCMSRACGTSETSGKSERKSASGGIPENMCSAEGFPVLALRDRPHFDDGPSLSAQSGRGSTSADWFRS